MVGARCGAVEEGPWPAGAGGQSWTNRATSSCLTSIITRTPTSATRALTDVADPPLARPGSSEPRGRARRPTARVMTTASHSAAHARARLSKNRRGLGRPQWVAAVARCSAATASSSSSVAQRAATICLIAWGLSVSSFTAIASQHSASNASGSSHASPSRTPTISVSASAPMRLATKANARSDRASAHCTSSTSRTSGSSSQRSAITQ